ncbi:MAG: TonB-dependent receptor domain-containing protein, partial [Bacteroidota bacterium]
SSNIRIINQWKDNHKITTGLSAEYQNNDIDGISFMIPAFELFTAGGYLLHEWKVNNNLQVSGGLRYDRAILKTESYYDWFPTQGIFLQRAEKLDKSFGSFSGMLGANYHSGKSIFRINLGRSFRIPLAKELAANGINYHRFSYEVGDPSLQPEIAWQLDMGAEYATPLWQARISPFISYFPNYLYLNPGFEFDFSSGAGNQVFYYTGSEVFRWGGEFTFMIEPVKNLIIDFSAEYVYSEQLDGAKKGFTIPFSPPASLLTEFGWNPWGEQKFSKLRFLSFSLETRFTMPQNRIVPPEKKTDGYNVFSAGVGGKGFLYGNKFDWRFRVNNLFDTHYLEHTSHYRLIGVPEPGRNFTFSVNIPFEIIQSKENNT